LFAAGFEPFIGHISFGISHLSFLTSFITSRLWSFLTMEEQAQKDSGSIADELEDRLVKFAVRIIKLSACLPRTAAGKHIANQILRSGTSPAPNYGEARGAESRADFVHKLRIVLKELNETSIWLRIIERSRLLKAELLRELMQENGELCRIFATSLKTARTRH
jgi:four helix bundle protein